MMSATICRFLFLSFRIVSSPPELHLEQQQRAHAGAGREEATGVRHWAFDSRRGERTHMAAMTSSAAGGSSSRHQEALPRCFRFLAVAPWGSPRLSTSLNLDGVRDPSPPPLPLVLPDQLGMNCCIMRVGRDTEARESKESQSQESEVPTPEANTVAFGTSACVFVLLSIAMPRRRVPNCNCHRQCFPLRLHAGTGE
jgi:hypothetical protein